MEFHGEIKDGKLVLSAAQQELRRRLLASYKDGTRVRETLTKKSPAKTHQQIKTIFGLVVAGVLNVFEDNGWDSSILLNTERPTGIPVSKELLKEYFYAVCPIYDNNENRITLSKTTIDKAAQFINETRNWAASQWGIDIPDPDPNWKDKLQ